MSTFTSSSDTVRFTDTDGPVSFTATTGAVTFTAAYQSVTGSGGGASTLDDLTDVTAPTPANLDGIHWNGSAWVNMPALEAHGIIYQHTDVIATATSPYVMAADDRIVITAGSAVTLPDAEVMVGQEVTIYATNTAVIVSPYAGQSILGQPTYTIENSDEGPNCAKFVAVDATAITGGAVTWTWAATLRSGPQWDLPDWQSETQGAILAVNSTPAPAWLDVGTADQVLSVSSGGGVLEWKTPSAAAANVTYDGSGLFDIAANISEGVNAAEGALDRWQFVKAYSTTNVNLALYTSPSVSSVATQPTLDDGIAPPEDTACDVYLFGQTTPSENGLYLVNATTGVWTKYTEPTQFDPGNGHRVNCTENGANFIYLDDGIVANVARSRRVSDFAAAAEASGTGQWYRMPDASTTLTASPGGGTVDVVSNVAQDRILGRTASGSGNSEELTAANVKTFLGISATAETLLDDASTAAMRTTLGVAPPRQLTVTGQYTASTSFASATSGLTNNRLYYVPVHVPRDITFTRLAVNQVATGSAGASSVGKFGIYNNTSDLPAAAFDRPAGTIDLTTGTGLKYVSGSWALTAGIWWIGFVAQVTSGSPTFGTAIPSIVVPSSDATSNGTKFEGSVSGTLPATATPGAANTTSAPIIYLYV